MSAIFSNATCAVVWFGEASEESRLGLFVPTMERYAEHRNRVWVDAPTEEQMATFHTEVPVVFETAVDVRKGFTATAEAFLDMLFDVSYGQATADKPGDGPRSVARQIPVRDAKSLVSDLRRLIANPYWSRLWIVQEIIMAKQPLFVSGGKLLTCRILALACAKRHELCRGLSSEIYEAARLVDRVLHLSSSFDGVSRQPLLTLVRDFAQQKCQDPRDHVFGLVSMSREANTRRTRKAKVKVDYSASPAQVFCMALGTFDGLPPWPLDLSCIDALLSSLHITPSELKMHAASQASVWRCSISAIRLGEQHRRRSWNIWDVKNTTTISQSDAYELFESYAAMTEFEDLPLDMVFQVLLVDGSNWIGLALKEDWTYDEILSSEISPEAHCWLVYKRHTIFWETPSPNALKELSFSFVGDEGSIHADLRALMFLHEFAKTRFGSTDERQLHQSSFRVEGAAAAEFDHQPG